MFLGEHLGLANIDNADSKHPPKPVEPLETDCCGSGCPICVFDLYDLEIKRWRARCDAIDNDDDIHEVDDVISQYEYRLFYIDQIKNISDCIKIFQFKTYEKLPLKCGQHLVARSYDETGKGIIRPYTPVSRLNEANHFQVVAKLYENGKMSTCMKHWNINSMVEWRGPFGDFTYQSNQFSSILMLAGGTGVTPMIQVVQSILDNEEDFTFLYLIYSIQSADDILMKHLFDSWQSYWNFKITYCLTKNGTHIGKFKYFDKFHLRRIDEEIIKEVLPETLQLNKIQVLICGTRSFNKDMYNLAQGTLQISETNIKCF